MQTPSTSRSWILQLRPRTTHVPEKQYQQSWNGERGAWSLSPHQARYGPVPGLPSVVPAKSPEGPFLSCEPPPTSDKKKQMGSPELGGSLLAPDPHHSLLPPSPAQTEQACR